MMGISLSGQPDLEIDTGINVGIIIRLVMMINPLEGFLGIRGHVALNIYPGPIRYPTLAVDNRRSFKCMSP